MSQTNLADYSSGPAIPEQFFENVHLAEIVQKAPAIAAPVCGGPAGRLLN